MDLREWQKTMDEKPSQASQKDECMKRQKDNPKYDVYINQYIAELACKEPITPEFMAQYHRQETRRLIAESLGETIGAIILIILIGCFAYLLFKFIRKNKRI